MSSCSAATIALTPGVTVTPDRAVAGRFVGSAARPAFPAPVRLYSSSTMKGAGVTPTDSSRMLMIQASSGLRLKWQGDTRSVTWST